jgi:hypothetical protein
VASREANMFHYQFTFKGMIKKYESNEIRYERNKTKEENIMDEARNISIPAKLTQCFLVVVNDKQ